METIYYTSDIKWFNHATGKYESKHHALRAHVEYALNSKDCQLYDGDKNRIFERARLADKRVNSNIAFSFNTALPNDLSIEQVKKWIDDVKEILSALLDMDKNDILVAFHDSKGISQMGNKHLHIIGLNLKSDGKALTINKNTLRSLHQALQQLILRKGYTIRKDEQPIGHLGPRLHYDTQLRQDYLSYLETKQVYRETLRKTQERKKQEEERRKQEEEKKRKEELQRLQSKKEEVLKAMEKNLSDVKTSYVRFEKRLTETGKQKFNRFFDISNSAMESVRRASTNDELRQIVLSYNQEAKQIFDLIDWIDNEIEKKKQAKQEQAKQQEQNPAQPKQPVQQQEIKSQPKIETKPAQPIQPKPQEPQVQPQAKKPAEPPKQITTKPQSTQMKPQEPIQKTAKEQEQQPQGKIEDQKPVEPRPQTTIKPAQTQLQAQKSLESKLKETPKQEEKAKPKEKKIEAQQIETPPQPETRSGETIETKPTETPKEPEPTKKEKKERRYILLYEVEEDADWYWENYIANSIDEDTRAETYELPERLQQEHIDRLIRIAKKGHVIDILITNEEYYYVNYEALEQLKDLVNIMVIQKPEQVQRQKNQDREEKQDMGYHGPMR